jgi:hypothetical protein
MRNDLHRRTRRAKSLFQQEKIDVHFDEKVYKEKIKRYLTTKDNLIKK